MIFRLDKTARDEAFRKKLKSRQRKDRSFRILCTSSLSVAVIFLVFFFYDIISKAIPAFEQAQIEITVDINDELRESPWTVVPEDLEELVSRGFSRVFFKTLEANPDWNGPSTFEALATDEVDQYLKGHYNSLSAGDRRLVDQMRERGKIELNFNTGFFTNGDSKIPELSGLFSAFVGSIMVLGLTALFAFPVGVATAIYLEEFAPNNRITQIIETNINNLAAVPSIIFGLLGLSIFINYFGVPRSSSLAGGLTLALMTLPTIIIATRAALRAVPQSIRWAGYGVGCSKWQTVRDHVLPLSTPGILTGTIIGLAQAMGETAPLLIIGMIAYIPDAPETITSAATVLPAQIFTWAGMPERAYIERTAAAILVLLAVLLTMNAAAVYLRNRLERKW